MYPLNVVLVGGADNLLAQVKKELARRSAYIEAEVANAAAAVDRFAASKEERRLFIVHVRSSAELDELPALGGTFAGMPVAAMLEAEDGVTPLIRANRAGATQVIRLPLDSADFQAALDCIAVHFGYADSQGMVVAVSPVSDAGAHTALGVNLAHAMAARPELRCLYIEWTPLGDSWPAFAAAERRTALPELVRPQSGLNVFRLQKALVAGIDGLDILPGATDGRPREGMTAAELAELFTCARWLAEAVVMEIPCTFDEFYFQAAEAADEVVLVAEQSLAALRSLKLAIEAFSGLPRQRLPHLVVERYDPQMRGLTRADLQKFLQVPDVLTIAADPYLANAPGPWRQAAPRSAAVADLNRLAHALLGARDPENLADAGAAHWGWLGRILHRE
jgi:hypothetical protein